MGKLVLTCHKCGFVAAIDSREVALMSGWTFVVVDEEQGDEPCCPACRVDGVCEPGAADQGVA